MARLVGQRLILVQIRVWISRKVSGEIKKGTATKNNRTLGHAQKNMISQRDYEELKMNSQ